MEVVLGPSGIVAFGSPLQDDCKNWTLETCLLALLLSAVTQHDYVVEPRY
jgi:hypothetical protein